MSIILHELALANDIRPSPFCWHVRFALEHKKLPYTAVPTGFTTIPRIAGGGYKTVPIMEDRAGGGHTVGDSWAIAEYLETAYADRPSLFGSIEGKAQAVFIRNWLGASVRMPFFKTILLDIYNNVRPEERDYFRTSREQRVGMTMENFSAGRLEQAAVARASLEPLRLTVKEQPFLAGKAPLYADYLVAGYLMWWRAVSPACLLEASDPLTAWFERLLALYPRIATESTRTWEGP